MESLKNLKQDQHTQKNAVNYTIIKMVKGKCKTVTTIILKAARGKNNSLDKKDPQLDYQHISHRPGGNRMI